MDDPTAPAGAATDPKKLAWAAGFTGLQVPGASTAPAPTLKLGMTKDERDKCDAFLKAHVSIVLRQGGMTDIYDDYLPTLDGKPSAEPDIIAAVMALTSAGFSVKNGGAASGPLYDGTHEEVTGLVKTQLLILTQAKVMAAPTARAVQGAVQDAMHGTTVTVPRAKVQEALTEYFQKVMAAQKGKSMKIDEPVRQVLQGLAQGLPGMTGGLVPPKDSTNVNPAQFAAEVAKKLPDPFPAANLDVLQRISPKAVEAPNNSVSDGLAGIVGKEAEALISLLPKALQDPVRKAIPDAIASGTAAAMGALAQALSHSTLGDDTQKAITSSVEAALKLKEHGLADGPPAKRGRQPPGARSVPTRAVAACAAPHQAACRPEAGRPGRNQGAGGPVLASRRQGHWPGRHPIRLGRPAPLPRGPVPRRKCGPTRVCNRRTRSGRMKPYLSGMSRHTTRARRRCLPKRRASLALCGLSITKTRSAHSSSSGVQGTSASPSGPADAT